MVTGDLFDGLRLRNLYTFSQTVQGSIEVHALPTHIPLTSPLIAVLYPNLLSPWKTPSETRVVYHNAINPGPAPFNNAVNIPSLVQYITLQLPELGGGIGFRISAWLGTDIDLSIVTGMVRASLDFIGCALNFFLSMSVHQPFSPPCNYIQSDLSQMLFAKLSAEHTLMFRELVKSHGSKGIKSKYQVPVLYERLRSR